MAASARSEGERSRCSRRFRPTHLLGGIPVREVVGTHPKSFVDAQGQRHEARIGRRPRPMNVSPNFKKLRMKFPARVACVALQAAHGAAGIARDEHDTMALRVADRLVELSVYQPRERSHRRLLVRVPETLELEIVKEL
jgi:hypothetical protein